MDEVEVIAPDGTVGYIPKRQLQQALTKGGYTLSNPEMVEVTDPTGQRGEIPAFQLELAIQKGYKPYGDSWPALIGKSALKGLGAIADLPRLGAEALQGLYNSQVRNLQEEVESGSIPLSFSNKVKPLKRGDMDAKSGSPQLDIAQYVPSTGDIREQIKKHTGVDLEPHPTTGAQRIVSNAAEFAGGVTPFGLAAKAPSIGNKLFSAFKNAGNAASIGAASGVLQEGGVNPLVADITASVANPTPTNLYAGFQKAKELPSKLAMNAIGLTPNKFNLEAAQAARDLGIDLPAAVLTDSKLTAIADQLVGKTPFFGDRLANKYKNAEQQSKNVLNQIYDEVSPKRTPEYEEHISKLFKQRVNELPQDARVLPTNTDANLNKIKFDTAILSPGEQEVLNRAKIINQDIRPESKLISEFGPINVPLQEYPVSRLAGTKQSLNSIIKWDTPADVRNLLKNVRHGVVEDIAEYGATNPAWYKKFQDADNLYGNLAKREKLEKTLGAAINPSTNDLGYAALSKRIHRPEINKILKRDLPPEVFEKVEKLGKVARAMAQKNRSIPNPSGTAPTSYVLGLLSTLHTPATLASIVGGEAATRLLTDKKFLDLAIKAAENPSAKFSAPAALSRRIKDVTGLPPAIIMREIQRQQGGGG